MKIKVYETVPKVYDLTPEEVQEAVNAGLLDLPPQLNYSVVDKLPEVGEALTVYIVADIGDEGITDTLDGAPEYIYCDNRWEQIGVVDRSFDLYEGLTDDDDFEPIDWLHLGEDE